MIDQERSGVAFGRDPREPAPARLEAGSGAIAGGGSLADRGADQQRGGSCVGRSMGGMLIHGAIIARKLGIPCVNGIPHAVEIVEEGAIVTVDGCLGIVTVGAPEFDLEVA
jgi:signal transduction protein with GAF and PtsI domain